MSSVPRLSVIPRPNPSSKVYDLEALGAEYAEFRLHSIRPLTKCNPLYRALTFSLLMVTWVVFSGLFDAFHLGLGVLSSLAVTGLSWRLLWTRPDLSMKTRFRQALGFVRYLAWLLGQIVFSNVHILQLAFSSKQKVRPVIVHHRTKLKTDFARYVFAQSITLTPGTVTVKIDDDELVVHAIDQKAAEGLDGSMERRIAAILEPELLDAGGAS